MGAGIPLVKNYGVSAMTRSYRHVPITGITTARSERDDKRRCNRAWRRRVRVILCQQVCREGCALDAILLPENPDEILSVWSMAKDGRQHFFWRTDRPKSPHGRGFMSAVPTRDYWHEWLYGRWPTWEAWGK